MKKKASQIELKLKAVKFLWCGELTPDELNSASWKKKDGHICEQEGKNNQQTDNAKVASPADRNQRLAALRGANSHTVPVSTFHLHGSHFSLQCRHVCKDAVQNHEQRDTFKYKPLTPLQFAQY